MDEIDRKIINLLKENARMSYTSIAKKVGLSEGAVRKRVNELITKGVIKKFTIILSQKEEVEAIILASVDALTSTASVSEKISKIEGVRSLYEITGQYDIAVLISASDMETINKYVDQIRQIEGVTSTNTMIVLRRWLPK